MKTKQNSKAHVHTFYRTVEVDGVHIFYREAGNPGAPSVLLLHGFPTSSHMFRHLIPLLADKYHVVAPDYPGFGRSDSPSPDTFAYTFEQLSEIMERFTDKLGLTSINLYMQDYGGPVGFRIAVRRPELFASFIIQNANAYTEGFGRGVLELNAVQDSGDKIKLNAAIDRMISYEGIRQQYLNGVPDTSRISPDAYLLDHIFVEQEGRKEIQRQLMANYPSNFEKYPEWQAYFRKQQPPALILWGKNDSIFIAAGAKAYLKDLEKAQLHLLDGGHFVLEEHPHLMADLIRDFLDGK